MAIIKLAGEIEGRALVAESEYETVGFEILVTRDALESELGTGHGFDSL